MSAIAFLVVAATVLATSFLSGVLGMAGGLVLMAVLLAVMPVSAAMVVHGAVQAVSNCWRAYEWRAFIDWRILGRYALGSVAAFLAFTLILFVPSRATVLILLGLMPFVAALLPERIAPNIQHRFAAEGAGALCTGLQLMAGVSGPALDVFFVRAEMDRRAVVATKAICTAVTHALKLVYFGGVVGAAVGPEHAGLIVVAIGLAILGTRLSRGVLDRMSDTQFRAITKWVVMGIGAILLVQGVRLALA